MGNIVWLLGWRPKRPFLCTPRARNCVFGSLEGVSLKCTMPENIVWVLGWRPNHPYHCTPWARNCVFGSVGWVFLNWTMPENIVWVLGWRPNHPYIPLHTMGQKLCFWIPRMGVFELHNARK